jgi:hypothetical protein
VGLTNTTINSETIYATTASGGVYNFDPADFVTCPTDGDVLMLSGTINTPGASILRADSTTAYSSLYTQANVNLNFITSTIVALNVLAPNPKVTPGTTTQLSIDAMDQNWQIISPPPAVTWISSDPLVATVDQNGLVTGVTPGIVTITASDGVGSGTTIINVGAQVCPA